MISSLSVDVKATIKFKENTISIYSYLGRGANCVLAYNFSEKLNNNK